MGENRLKVEELLFEKYYSKIYKILLNAKKSKYYGELLRNIDFSQKITYEMFSSIPITAKEDYRNAKFDIYAGPDNGFSYEKFNSFNIETESQERAEYGRKFDIERYMTSGSTGQPLEVLKTTSDNFNDYMVLNYYRKKLTDYNFADPYIWVWPNNPLFGNKDSDGLSKRVKVKSNGCKFALLKHSNDDFKELYEFVKGSRYKWITTSPSVLVNFADYINSNHLQPIDFKYIECHSENLYDWQRETIQSTFGVSPVSIYSSNEIQFMGAKCNRGNMHVFANGCFIESVNTGKANELIVTSLNYYGFPIIRYKIGDVGQWSTKTCDCALSSLPILELSGYRTNDFVKLRDGSILETYIITDGIYLLNNSKKLNITKYKIVQTDYDSFDIYLPQELCSEHSAPIQNFMSQYLGTFINEDIRVQVKNMDIEKTRLHEKKFKYFETLV